jgi:TRAP-type mannitol/chloroaromatic compound transport system permease small subunit
MKSLLGLSRGIDWISTKFGLVADVTVTLACFVSAGNATLRYLTNFLPDGFREFLVDWRLLGNSSLEMQWYLFAAMVMLGGAYTLLRNEHVRVDLVYGNVSVETRQWIDLLGCIFFLIPMCVMMIYITLPWVIESYRFNETSTNAGGLIRWPVKALLPLGFFLLLLQGISELIKTLAAMNGYIKIDNQYERPLQ